VLHTVNKSPFQKDSLEACFRLAAAGSDVLLIEDAVYAALAGARFAGQVEAALGRCAVYALKEDLDARGIERGDLIPGIEVVDYGGFVDLAERNDSVQSWL